MLHGAGIAGGDAAAGDGMQILPRAPTMPASKGFMIGEVAQQDGAMVSLAGLEASEMARAS